MIRASKLMCWLTLATIVASFGVAAPYLAAADKAKDTKSEPAKPANSAAKPGASSAKEPTPPKNSKDINAALHAREAAALAFVRAHHAELNDLLAQLKTVNPAEYRKAVQDLFRTSERLAQLAEKNPERYGDELEAWQLQSRIQLLVARLTMGSDEAAEEQLRSLLRRQLELQRERLLADRQRVADRLAEMDAQLKELVQQEDEQIERRLERLRTEARKFGVRKNGGKAGGDESKKDNATP